MATGDLEEIYGDYWYLTQMAQNAPKGPPKQVFWEMEAAQSGNFDEALDEYIEMSEPTGGDALTAYEEDWDDVEDDGGAENDLIDDMFLNDPVIMNNPVITEVWDSFDIMEDGDLGAGLDVLDAIMEPNIPVTTIEQGLSDVGTIVNSTLPIDDIYGGLGAPYLGSPLEELPTGPIARPMPPDEPPPTPPGPGLWNTIENVVTQVLGMLPVGTVQASGDEIGLPGQYTDNYDYDYDAPLDPTLDPLWDPPRDEDVTKTTVTVDPDTLAMWKMLDAAYPDIDQIRTLMDDALYTAADISAWMDQGGWIGTSEFRTKLETAMEEWGSEQDEDAGQTEAGKKKQEEKPERILKEYYKPGTSQVIRVTEEEYEAKYKDEGWLLSPGQDTQQTTAVKTGADALPSTPPGAVPDKAPSYLDQFRRIFNTIPGSQRFEAQSGMPAMFTDAETLFYLTEDWTAREEVPREWLDEARLRKPSLEFSEQDRKGEELIFANWVRNTYLKDPRRTRFGQGFYKDVRDLRTRMLAIKDLPMEDLYDTLAGDYWAKVTPPTYPYQKSIMGDPAQSPESVKKTVMDRFVFMDPKHSSRLAQLVGMYNIHPGADHWLRAKMMNFYRGMMDNWQASGRDSYDFIEAFVKDKPAMPGGGVSQPPGGVVPDPILEVLPETA